MKTRKAWPILGLLVGLFVLSTAVPTFASDEATRVDKAAQVLKEAVTPSNNAIPARVFKDAYGVAVIPELWKAALLGGGQHGNGVLMVRKGDKWSDPAFISITGASAGAQVGFETADVVLVFRNKNDVDKLLKGRFELGADASVAIGPYGAKSEGSTTPAKVLSYVKEQGAFIGASLSGAVISVDEDADAAFYNNKNVTPSMIFAGKVKAPRAVIAVQEQLDKLAG